jgi:hypothetical protein
MKTILQVWNFQNNVMLTFGCIIIKIKLNRKDIINEGCCGNKICQNRVTCHEDSY